MQGWTEKQPKEPGYYLAISKSDNQLDMVEVVEFGEELEAYPTGWDCGVGLEDYALWSDKITIPPIPSGFEPEEKQ